MKCTMRTIAALACFAACSVGAAAAGPDSASAEATRAGKASADKARPNVLFLFADDQRADGLAALGNPVLKTPQLDRLVHSGLNLRNAYCLGSNAQAVCSPSRNMLLSGRAYFRWQGRLASAEEPNFPASMKAAGYETYHHGKKSNTATAIQALFEHNKYVNDNYDRTNGQPCRDIANDAIAFLENRHDPRPFFMYLAFSNPHDPRVAAEEYRRLYDESLIPLPKNYLPLHPFDNGDMDLRDERLAPWPRTESEVRRQLHDYYAVISAMDHHIGRLLARLDELGLRDNTIIIYSADHGLGMGSHGLMGKQSLYDSHMKPPLIFSGPGIKPGQSDALVYLMDIFPTVCDLVGAPIPPGLDGRSFADVLHGKSTRARDHLFLAYREVQRAIRDDRWKLIRYPQVNVTQLFDLKHDPDEIHNLASDADQAGRIEKLTATLQQDQEHYGDRCPLVVKHQKDPKWTPPAK